MPIASRITVSFRGDFQSATDLTTALTNRGLLSSLNVLKRKRDDGKTDLLFKTFDEDKAVEFVTAFANENGLDELNFVYNH